MKNIIITLGILILMTMLNKFQLDIFFHMV